MCKLSELFVERLSAVKDPLGLHSQYWLTLCASEVDRLAEGVEVSRVFACQAVTEYTPGWAELSLVDQVQFEQEILDRSDWADWCDEQLLLAGATPGRFELFAVSSGFFAKLLTLVDLKDQGNVLLTSLCAREVVRWSDMGKPAWPGAACISRLVSRFLSDRLDLHLGQISRFLSGVHDLALRQIHRYLPVSAISYSRRYV